MLVIAELILHINNDIQTAQRADGQPENIDKAESSVLYQEPVCRFEIVFEHAGCFCPHRIQENAIFISRCKSIT
jgi:hypothetical protein